MNSKMYYIFLRYFRFHLGPSLRERMFDITNTHKNNMHCNPWRVTGLEQGKQLNSNLSENLSNSQCSSVETKALQLFLFYQSASPNVDIDDPALPERGTNNPVKKCIKRFRYKKRIIARRCKKRSIAFPVPIHKIIKIYTLFTEHCFIQC